MPIDPMTGALILTGVDKIGGMLGLWGDDDDGSEAAAAATQAQVQAQQQAMAAQERLMREAMQTQLATGLYGQQIGYDLSRATSGQNQLQQLPYRIASQSALQALPALQQLLGMTPYAIPTNIQMTGLPEVNFMQAYQQALADLQPQVPPEPEGYSQEVQTAAGPSGGAGPAGLWRGAQAQSVPGAFRNTGAVSAPSPAQTTGPQGTSPMGQVPNVAYQMQPMEGQIPGATITGSPLYQWQQKRATEALQNQLGAAGLGQGTYAQRELARVNEGLAAQERERVVRDLSNQVQWGMGMPGLSPLQTPDVSGLGSAGINQSNLLSSLASGQASGFSNIGAAQGQGLLAQAQLAANKPNTFGDLASMAWMWGNRGGGSPMYRGYSENEWMHTPASY